MNQTTAQERRTRLANATGDLVKCATLQVSAPGSYNLAELCLSAIEYAAAIAQLERSR